MKILRSTLPAFALAATLLAGACTPSVDLRGNLPTPENLAQIKAGKTTRDEVQTLLGSPSATATYGEESWQYISARTETTAFFKPELKDRKVVSISFDKSGVVKDVVLRGMDDGITVQTVDRETPTAGKELSILEQLVGNIGKFSKDPAGKGP
ncbi:MAG TPA: outer membrane protein assembly factor BamE [Magnetospirillum sp.]|jgi:outer membrane protein assembly factor BamE (lipoprotein component of BamABCDE complex)|nr:outer membrane protein assembly factor BamE [Magnetospirillum sp.]